MSSPENETLKKFISSGGDNEAQEIISKLKFISQIEQDKIVDTQTLTLCNISFQTSAYRTLLARNQSRNNALRFFQECINNAFSIGLNYIDSKEGFIKRMGMMIMKAIENSIKGLENHAKTYSEDVLYKSKIDTLISATRAKLNAYTCVDDHPHIGNDSDNSTHALSSNTEDEEPVKNVNANAVRANGGSHPEAKRVKKQPVS